MSGLKGLAQVRQRVNKTLLETIPSKAEKAAFVAITTGGGLANTYAPKEFGVLRRSQYRTVEATQTGATGRVGYAANYAAAVHAASGKLKGKKRRGEKAIGNYWDPDARPAWLSFTFVKHRAEIDEVVRKAMTL